jgi:death-on-curing protein
MVINRWGGRAGIHNEGGLESALSHPFMLLDYGQEEEQELSYLAATYFFHIIKNHPFIDGNKRTGLLTTLEFLARNNYELIGDSSVELQNSLYILAVNTAASQITKEQIAGFFKKLMQPIS